MNVVDRPSQIGDKGWFGAAFREFGGVLLESFFYHQAGVPLLAA